MTELLTSADESTESSSLSNNNTVSALDAPDDSSRGVDNVVDAGGIITVSAPVSPVSIIDQPTGMTRPFDSVADETEETLASGTPSFAPTHVSELQGVGGSRSGGNEVDDKGWGAT